MQPLRSDILNFKTSKASSYFIECGDTHKAWQSFEVFMHGIVLELIHLYSKSSPGQELNAYGFFEWQKNCSSATLKLIFSFVLTYGFAMYCQKVGDRNNDVTVSDAGRYSFLDFFYGFNHPIYQEIEYRDLRVKAIYPEEIRRQLDENVTFSSSDLPNKGQGGDFLLEQKIKRQKMLSPKGPVNKATWQKISRCLDKFDCIYKNVSSNFNLGEEAGERIALLSEEILEWRSVLRYSKYFEHEEKQTVFNIHGEVLENDFLNFSLNLKEKRVNYWKLHLNGRPIENIRMKPILINKPLDDSEEDSE